MARGRYADYPKTIFGLSPSQHRAFKIREVLVHYRKRCGVKATKLNMLRQLIALEEEVTAREKKCIQSWLSGHEGYKGVEEVLEDDKIAVKAGEDQEVSVLNRLMHRSSRWEKIAASWEHEPTVCSSCLTQSVDSQIQDKAWDQINCPECVEMLSFEMVKKVASVEAFERYDRIAVMLAFREMPNFTMCLGPRCDSGQMYGGGDAQPIMTCTSCRFKTCFTHKMPWHEGQTCAEYNAAQKDRVQQEDATAKLLEKTTKICPNPKCGLHVAKIDGYDHMYCYACHYQSCWLCLASHKAIQKEGNTAHSRTCKYHTDNLNGIPGHR